MMVQEFAPAKVNLTLHITGQRDDGYHLLDSLVMFASVGDTLTLSAAKNLALEVDGPEAPSVPIGGNSVLSAAEMLAPSKGALLRLTKTLPVAAGIGGGTADAAAAYRGLSQLWGLPSASPTPSTFNHVAKLGADVPVCLFSRTARMSGIGDQVEFLPDLPRLNAVLINPRTPVSTPDVFNLISSKNNPSMTGVPDATVAQGDFVAWLATQRNDMQQAAVTLAPIISDVLSALAETTGCQLARMSGSGATCFGIYPDAHAASKAASAISQAHPDWWVQPCTLGDGA
ncbi:4-(cytidine 5'-diphospho)-2-C-methyl-D-erythritol kinase [Litoreibacter albidus]|uniref:4-diphosphocytidyl-2-C-methyl-D-erythritol kinase n=1 Tax=Litoreibacter albidus TaxID=670155 RepID=A0A1H2UTL1_9RHOB|nr:4-(cytidine 5'-diphospho)-2-C-methyl-D-erythritol kinase [Litoreibacter albidus]SDW59430.1 4-diphosphocytidyl-2-C-methyl-D-erythritol kinase [Litoreibacter albidus]